jgi:hypothetical protein
VTAIPRIFAAHAISMKRSQQAARAGADPSFLRTDQDVAS